MVVTHYRKYVFVALAIVILVAAIVYFKNSSPSTLSTPIDISFSPKWVNQAQFAGEFVAKDLGYYSSKGLGVTIKEFQVGGSVLKDLENGTSQVGLMSANEFLLNVSEGKHIKAVAAFYQVSPFMVASLSSNPVRSPEELKGKRLGIKGGSGSEGKLVYEFLLASAGLRDTDVTFVYLPFGYSEKDDLLAGRVDVIGFYRDELYHFDQSGVTYTAIYPEQYGSALYNDLLVVTDDFLATHPDAVRVFLRTTIDGWKYAYAHQDTAISITLRYVTAENYKDINYERYILKESEDLMTNGGSVPIGTMDVSHLQRFYDALLRQHLIKQPFDVHAVVTNDFLPQ